ncbi:MAG: heavy metal-binding domain-containing protein [Actinomycetota bacterium]|nr:heavy metal-binding domain-containing protein [Actinomycetota bacterium]
MQRLIEEAQKMGADAVVGMRFDNSDFANVTEICAYGTAVKLAPLS